MATLNDKNVGDIIKIKENGVDVNYTIVHKGKPNVRYDNSCDGVWVIRQMTHSKGVWDETTGYNDYENSDIHAWLNGTFLNTIDEKIRAAIKTVKIPFFKGRGNDETSDVYSGSMGLSCKVFLLSGYETGFTESGLSEYLPIDGTKLSYFSNNTSRIARNNNNTAAAQWWLRSPNTDSGTNVWYVSSSGYGASIQAYNTNLEIRPAFVLPYDLLINSDGTVLTNTPPTITSNKTGNLGTLTSGFTCNYEVNDADASDSVTVTLTLDGAQKSTFTAVKGTLYTYTLTGNNWLKITNGSHTFKISATDGKDTVESTATFTRSVSGAAITLDTPLEADDVIRACSLKISGSLPADTNLLCEVTNNGNDTQPVWENCTAKVKAEMPYLFQNRAAENGFAFNFRIAANRGASGTGGYITKISGGFE